MTTETLLFFISAAVTGVICFILVKLRIGDIQDERMKGFFPLSLCTMGWIMMNAAVFVIGHTEYAAFYTVRMLFACMIPYLTCWFFLNFSESGLAKSRLLCYALAAVCAADIAALLTNPLHRLYFINYDYPFPGRGIFAALHVVFLSAVMALAYAVLLPYIARNFRRWPLLLLTGFGAVMPYALYMLYVLQRAEERYDFSPLGFFFSVVLFAFFSYTSKMSFSCQAKLNDALAEITKSPDISTGDTKKAAEELAQKGCLALGATRLSIWTADKDTGKLKNVTCYSASADGYTVLDDFSFEGHAAYENHIRNKRLLVIHDLRLPNPLASPWIGEPGVCAVLDAPIRIDGQLAGVICVDQIRCKKYPQKREWTLSEQNFASTLADLMSIAMIGGERRALAVRNEEFVSNMPGAIYQALNNPPAYTVSYVSPGIRALSGLAPEELIGGSMLKLYELMHPDDIETSLKLRAETLRRGLPMEYQFRITPKDGGEKWIWERSKVAKTAPDGRPLMFEGFYTDVTEHRRREAAEAANEAKSAFLARMSHEMRTPLSAVIGLSELVLENDGLSADNEIYLDKIHNAGSTLLSIVNDILDIARIEAGKFEITAQEYDVPSLINDAVSQNILRIHSKPVRFALNISEDAPVRLRGDNVRVRQVLSNLLSNAFKYTAEGTVELSIDFERGGDSVWTTFRVRDTGAGIRPDDLSSLFSDYTRFDEAINRETGTGLGLSITKKLVGLMGGDVTVESEYGKGSVFTAKIRQQPLGDAVIGEETARHLRSLLYTTGKRRSGSQLNRVRMPYARVLVVDDNLTNLDIAHGLMRPYGMDIDCVTSGQAAIDAIREEKCKYNAVFMDHMMPDMDGIEAVRVIRNEIGSAYAREIPIIALTANAVIGSKELFISQGFNEFVSKPIDIFKLDEVIRKWIWHRHGEQTPEIPCEFVDRRKRPDRRKGGGDRRVIQRRSETKPNAVNGLDWAKGVERFGGEDAFRRVLLSFAVNTKPLLEQISKVGEDALAAYAITVHGIKSSGRGVGADALGALAESLELEAKNGNFGFIARHNADFLEMAHRIIAEIETLPDETGQSEAKPKKSRPGAPELRRLYAACADYDMNAIEAAMQEIESCAYTDDDGLVGWLRDNIARLNYAQITEKIAQAVNTNPN